MTRIRYFKIFHRSDNNRYSLFKCVPIDYYKDLTKLKIYTNNAHYWSRDFVVFEYVIFVTTSRSKDNLITYYNKLEGGEGSLLDSPSVISYEEITREDFFRDRKKLHMIEELLK